MANETLDELVDNFALFDDWEERYRYLIDLGRTLPSMDESLKTEENLVKGCTSRVWMQADLSNNTLNFVADSDAHIVRGLIAVLVTLASGRTVAEICAMDIRAELTKLQLEQALSAQRSNGLRAMVARIEDIARAAQAA